MEVELSCLVEIPKGSRNTYEYDEERGVIRLDRPLFSSAVFPTDYGFLEGTLTEGGGHLDALVLSTEPKFPACRIEVRPIGIFQMRDEAGVDHKVLCVPLHDPEWCDVHELENVSPERVTAIEGWADHRTAEQEIAATRQRFVDATALRAGNHG
jgi:inorganic pyrophosphatase